MRVPVVVGEIVPAYPEKFSAFAASDPGWPVDLLRTAGGFRPRPARPSPLRRSRCGWPSVISGAPEHAARRSNRCRTAVPHGL